MVNIVNIVDIRLIFSYLLSSYPNITFKIILSAKPTLFVQYTGKKQGGLKNKSGLAMKEASNQFFIVPVPPPIIGLKTTIFYVKIELQ